MTTDQVWVEIDDTVSIGIERDEAMSLDRDGFVELYKRTVYPPPGFRARRAWKRDAEAWADRQIADRGGTGVNVLTDEFEAADFTGAEDYALEVIGAHRAALSAAEDELRRLTEGLRGRNQLLLSELDWIIGYATTAENEQWGERLTEKLTEFRALLSATQVEGFPSVAPTFGTYDAPERLREKGTE